MEISEKFSHLFEVISSKRFLSKESLGGEIPFFIAAYDAKKELEVQNSTKLLMKKLDTEGVSILELNLYDLACEILDEKGGVERLFRVERSKSKDKFLKALQSSLNIHQVLMPKISEMMYIFSQV